MYGLDTLAEMKYQVRLIVNKCLFQRKFAGTFFPRMPLLKTGPEVRGIQSCVFNCKVTETNSETKEEARKKLIFGIKKSNISKGFPRFGNQYTELNTRKNNTLRSKQRII